MSCVYVLASDKELPLCDFQEFRSGESGAYAVTLMRGFRVEPMGYYEQAVDELGYPMKPFRHEFTIEKNAGDLEHLRTYLKENFSQGEALELWNVWVGDVDKKCPPRYRGRLEEFDMEALEQFLGSGTDELCFTITV